MDNVTETICTTPDQRPPFDAAWEGRRRLAEALRRLNETALTTDIPAEDLCVLADRIAAETAKLAALPRIAGRKGHGLRHAERGEEMKDFIYEASPATGYSNAVSVPTHIWSENGTVHAVATPGWGQEGPSGCVHGGVIALLLDQLCGVAQRTSGIPGHTGTLTIRYRHLTPIGTPLLLKAKIARTEGRKSIVEAGIWVGDRCTVECEGIMIARKKSPT